MIGPRESSLYVYLDDSILHPKLFELIRQMQTKSFPELSYLEEKYIWYNTHLASLMFNGCFFRGIKKARTHVSSSNRHGEMNLARVLVTICVVFLVCNSLRLFLGLQAIINVNKTIQCVSINKAWIPPGWMLIMESVSHLLLLISSSSNFLIYCTISTKFKIYIKRNFFWR